MDLTPHPANPPTGDWQVRFSWQPTEHWLTLRWRVSGVGALAIPPLAGRGRANGLWEATAGMRQRKLPRAPVCSWRAGSAFSLFDAAIPLGGLPELPAAFGASAVIEETDGTKSYWALNHTTGKPDFHDPACFTARLPAPLPP